MEVGYIKLYRKITNSVVWTNPNMFKLWCLCLMKATHKESKFLFNGVEVVLKPGEFVTGREALAEAFNKGVKKNDIANSRTLWRYIKQFENLQMLSIQSNARYSVVSITNWVEYQQDVQQVSSTCPAPVHHLSTYKNDKNDKNDKNIKDNSQKSAKRTYDEDSVYYQLASFLFKEIKKNNPEARNPSLNVWADDIRKMIELDGRKEPQVRNMITWSQSNDFWKGIILSGKKLRDKYDQMKIQALQPKKQAPWEKQTKKEVVPDWVEDTRKPKEETPLEPEQQRLINERIAGLKSSGKSMEEAE